MSNSISIRSKRVFAVVGDEESCSKFMELAKSGGKATCVRRKTIYGYSVTTVSNIGVLLFAWINSDALNNPSNFKELIEIKEITHILCFGSVDLCEQVQLNVSKVISSNVPILYCELNIDCFLYKLSFVEDKGINVTDNIFGHNFVAILQNNDFSKASKIMAVGL